MIKKYGQNLSQNRDAVEANIQAEVKIYSKEKTKPYEQLANTATNMILDSLTFITQNIIRILKVMFDQMLKTINTLLEVVKDYLMSLMGSVEKEWKELLKPATPPTDLPSLIQWAGAIAAIFNKPLAQAAKVIVNFVVNMIPIIQLIIKKLSSSKTLLTECGPTLAVNAAVPPTVIPALIKHYIKPENLGLDISQLKFDASNPAVLVDSTTKIIQQYFPINAITSKQEKIKKRVIRDLYCTPPQNFCQMCLTGVYKKPRLFVYDQTHQLKELLQQYNNQQFKDEYEKYAQLCDNYHKIAQLFSVSGICLNCVSKQFNITKSLSKDFTLIYKDVNNIHTFEIDNLYTMCRNCNTVDTLYNMTSINSNVIFGQQIIQSNYLCSSCFEKFQKQQQKKRKQEEEKQKMQEKYIIQK